MVGDECLGPQMAWDRCVCVYSHIIYIYMGGVVYSIFVGLASSGNRHCMRREPCPLTLR